MSKAPSKDARKIYNEALALHRAGKNAEAVALYRKVLGPLGSNSGLWTNYGAVLRATGHTDAAIACHLRALELDPNNAAANGNLQNALRAVGRYAEALERCEAATCPDYTAFNRQYDRARNLERLERYSESVAAYNEAIRLNPKQTDLLFLRATALLGQGNWKRGLAEYEHRWTYGGKSRPKRVSPAWTGDAHPEKTLTVYGEQGLGDFLLTSRYLPVARQNFKALRIVVRRPLMRLFEGVDYVDEVIERSEYKGENEEIHIHAMDLLRVHGASLADVPPAVALNIPATSDTRAKEILAPYRGTFRIGIVWGGSSTFVNSDLRDAGLKPFLRLAEVPGVRLFGLYKGPREEELETQGAVGLIPNLAATESDLADTAATIRELDMVITTDTSVAHLAGTLGAPVWCALHVPAFWYWGSVGERSPWYPTMRLIRQKSTLDWDEPFDAIKRDLIRYLDTR